jgi:hypothetical protein
VIAAFAALKTARFWLKAAPWIAAVVATLALVAWVHGMQAIIAKQSNQINTLAVNLRAEQDGRKRDVQGLTVLAQGLAKISTDSAKDTAILGATIDAKNPKPVSHELAAFLGRLRDADSAAAVVQAAK